MAPRHGHPRSNAASPIAVTPFSLTARSNSNPFAIALAFLGGLAIFIALRDSSRRVTRTEIRPVYDGEASAHKPSPPYSAHPTQASAESKQECSYDNYVYPEWPKGFNVSVGAAFILGEQKSGSTWLWELLDAHPCLLTAAQPASLAGAITTKETYYFTSLKVGPDARQFLVPWMGYNKTYRQSDEAWQQLGNDWFEHALHLADGLKATNNHEFVTHRSYTSPGAKLDMKQCSKYYILEATPHNLNSPVVAKRMKGLFPDAKFMAVLKEPAWRMHSAYNQFSKPFLSSCNTAQPADWCPIYRYYQLKLPTFKEAVNQEIAYLQKSGCTFKDSTYARDWMSCFGCLTMDPWRHKADDINIMFPPYAPSAALSMYAPMLKAWSDHVSLDDMRIVNYQSLVDDPLGITNQMLRYLGLEEYTQKHMEILRPSNLGFKGQYQGGSGKVPKDVNKRLQEFFAPLNQQLDELLADHPIPWQPFKPHVEG